MVSRDSLILQENSYSEEEKRELRSLRVHRPLRVRVKHVSCISIDTPHLFESVPPSTSRRRKATCAAVLIAIALSLLTSILWASSSENKPERGTSYLLKHLPSTFLFAEASPALKLNSFDFIVPLNASFPSLAELSPSTTTTPTSDSLLYPLQAIQRTLRGIINATQLASTQPHRRRRESSSEEEGRTEEASRENARDKGQRPLQYAATEVSNGNYISGTSLGANSSDEIDHDERIFSICLLLGEDRCLVFTNRTGHFIIEDDTDSTSRAELLEPAGETLHGSAHLSSKNEVEGAGREEGAENEAYSASLERKGNFLSLSRKGAVIRTIQDDFIAIINQYGGFRKVPCPNVSQVDDTLTEENAEGGHSRMITSMAAAAGAQHVNISKRDHIWGLSADNKNKNNYLMEFTECISFSVGFVLVNELQAVNMGKPRRSTTVAVSGSGEGEGEDVIIIRENHTNSPELEAAEDLSFFPTIYGREYDEDAKEAYQVLARVENDFISRFNVSSVGVLQQDLKALQMVFSTRTISFAVVTDRSVEEEQAPFPVLTVAIIGACGVLLLVALIITYCVCSKLKEEHDIKAVKTKALRRALDGNDGDEGEEDKSEKWNTTPNRNRPMDKSRRTRFVRDEDSYAVAADHHNLYRRDGGEDYENEYDNDHDEENDDEERYSHEDGESDDGVEYDYTIQKETIRDADGYSTTISRKVRSPTPTLINNGNKNNFLGGHSSLRPPGAQQQHQRPRVRGVKSSTPIPPQKESLGYSERGGDDGMDKGGFRSPPPQIGRDGIYRQKLVPAPYHTPKNQRSRQQSARGDGFVMNNGNTDNNNNNGMDTPVAQIIAKKGQLDDNLMTPSSSLSSPSSSSSRQPRSYHSNTLGPEDDREYEKTAQYVVDNRPPIINRNPAVAIAGDTMMMMPQTQHSNPTRYRHYSGTGCSGGADEGGRPSSLIAFSVSSSAAHNPYRLAHDTRTKRVDSDASNYRFSGDGESFCRDEPQTNLTNNKSGDAMNAFPDEKGGGGRAYSTYQQVPKRLYRADSGASGPGSIPYFGPSSIESKTFFSDAFTPSASDTNFDQGPTAKSSGKNMPPKLAPFISRTASASSSAARLNTVATASSNNMTSAAALSSNAHMRSNAGFVIVKPIAINKTTSGGSAEKASSEHISGSSDGCRMENNVIGAQNASSSHAADPTTSLSSPNPPNYRKNTHPFALSEEIKDAMTTHSANPKCGEGGEGEERTIQSISTGLSYD